MKKMYALFLLAFGLAVPVVAQQVEEDVLRPRGKSAAEVAAESSAPSGSSSSGVRYSVGGETGFNYNMFSQDLERSVAISNSPEDVLKSGSGLSRTVAFFVDLPVTSFLGIQGKVLADQKKWSNTGKGGLDALNDDDDLAGTSVIDAEYETIANYLGAALLLRLDIGSTGFFVTAGPTYQFLIEDITRTDKLKISLSQEQIDAGFPAASFPVNYELEDGEYSEISRTTSKPEMMLPPVFDSQIGEYSSTRLGIEAGVGYRIPVVSPWLIVPQIRYNRQLSTLATETKTFDTWQETSQEISELTFKNAKVHSIQATISFVYQF